MVGQPLVIETEQMQNRGVQIVNVDAAFDPFPAKVVEYTVPDTGLPTASASQMVKARLS